MSQSQTTRPFKELADAMAPESRARAGAKAAELSKTTSRETITVNVYWPGEGAGGIPDRVETMEHAHAAAKRMAAMGYGAKSKAAKPNEIHIVRTVREVTVWSESDE